MRFSITGVIAASWPMDETQLGLIWLVAGVLAAAAEVATLGFFLAPFALGAFGAMFVAFLGGGWTPQLAAFAAVTVGCLLMLRPIVRRQLAAQPGIQTPNPDRGTPTEGDTWAR